MCNADVPVFVATTKRLSRPRYDAMRSSNSLVVAPIPSHPTSRASVRCFNVSTPMCGANTGMRDVWLVFCFAGATCMRNGILSGPERPGSRSSRRSLPRGARSKTANCACMPSNGAAAVALTALMCLLAGCSFPTTHVRASGPMHGPATWRTYQYGTDNNAVFVSGDVPPEWMTKVGGKINGALAVVGNTLYATSFDHHVYAIAANTGHIRWKADVGGVTMTTPVYDQDLVVVGTGTNQVLRDTPSSVLWGRPGGDHVVALHASDGRIAWKYLTIGEDMPSAAIVNERSKSPSVDFTNGDGHVRSLDLRTGKLLWQTYVNGVATIELYRTEPRRSLRHTKLQRELHIRERAQPK